ncbi:DsbA family protein [Ferrovibrio sp. MS7]|uniref:DsbA family protein n=1 Tax=Ferrovibrio plantarum TaxID=3119164 RepID=UPI00313560F7
MPLLRRLLIALLLLAGFVAGPVAAQQKAEPVPQELRDAVKESLLESPRLLEVLVRHPELINEAWQELKQQEATIKAALTENRKEIFDDGVSHVAGNPKGDVTLVEFFDYRCGYCKQVQPSVLALLKEDSRLRVVLKELPVLGPDSVVAARAAIAAQQQPGKYFAFHNAMMEHRGQLPEAEVLRIAKASGLDVAKLKADMAAPRVTEVIERNLALATKLGIQGTPGFVIGDEIVPGAIPLEAMRQLVKRQRGG